MKKFIIDKRMKFIACMMFFQIIQLQNIEGLGIINKNHKARRDSINFINNIFPANHEEKENGYPIKKVLVILGNCNDSLMTVAAGNELYNLLGHFNTSIEIINNKNYKPKAIRKYDAVFYIGLQTDESPSVAFMNDIYKWNKTIVWLNSGFSAFENKKDVNAKFGFSVGNIDHSKSFNIVKSGKKVFTRGGNELFAVQISNNKKAEVIANAVCDLPGKTLPYIVKSKNLYYIADIPYFNTSVTDRYLLFADVLHEIMEENHPEEHKAIVRIEDVTPIRDPERLRKIADILSERNIPFLIGVVPFYVDPTQNIRISLSNKPDLVAALKYCVSKGGSIVLHGITHQYKGISAIDFEFWDGSVNKPIANENESSIENKIEEGLNECAKNGIYPLYWETPHYTASTEDYKIISKYFSSSVERLIVTNSFKYGQFFPYEIHKDMYGQKVFPEDLGYMPLIPTKDSSELYITSILKNAKGLLNVRDSYASFFFHTFVNLNYLKEIADGISNLGYTFTDLRKETNWVKSKDLIILIGSQKYTFTPDNNELTEIYYNKSGQVEKQITSNVPAKGFISKKIILKPDEFYVAETKSNQVEKNIAQLKNNRYSKRDNYSANLHDKN